MEKKSGMKKNDIPKPRTRIQEPGHRHVGPRQKKHKQVPKY